jgi:Flp pilus assembly protein CpaB
MSLDKIVILVLALAFFGGLAYVAWKGKHEKKEGGQASSPIIPDQIEGDSSNKSKEKGRRSSKS